MKRRVITIIFSILLLLIIPVSTLCFGFFLPAQYGRTYYAELPKMYRKLNETEGKRIVFVGNSALAFGLSPDLIENEFSDYSVCPFGLYGAIGTKAMMDLSRSAVHEGDIVILAPELTAQSMSLYFSGEHMWNSADGDFGMLKYLRNGKEMAGAFLPYMSRKYLYMKEGNTPDPKSVYAVSSFDENCKMIYDRPYNQMPLGYDENERIAFDLNYVTESFTGYVNEYNAFIKERGATLLYGFTPVNVNGLALNTSEEGIDAFYDCLSALLDCEILGNPHEYIFDSDWFYDSNVHMNSYGSIVYTERIVRDLKTYFEDDSPVKIEIPEKPVVPDDDIGGEDGKDAASFVYETSGAGWKITGLTDEGRTKEIIGIPDFYQGKRVYSFDETVFAGNSVVKEIHIGKNIYGIADGSFAGCASLQGIYLSEEAKPSDCTVHGALFDGAPDFGIYVPQSKIADYRNDYWWSRYAARLIGY